MMFVLPVDWIAGTGTIITAWLFQRRRMLAANLFGLIVQGPWIALAVQTRSYGILPLEAILVALYVVELVRLLRRRKPCSSMT